MLDRVLGTLVHALNPSSQYRTHRQPDCETRSMSQCNVQVQVQVMCTLNEPDKNIHSGSSHPCATHTPFFALIIPSQQTPLRAPTPKSTPASPQALQASKLETKYSTTF